MAVLDRWLWLHEVAGLCGAEDNNYNARLGLLHHGCNREVATLPSLYWE